MNIHLSVPSKDTGPQLLHLVRSGKLFELQYWIKAGLPLHPCGKRYSAIVEAADTGFHSMVKVLLAAQGWDTEELAEAAIRAALDGQAEIALMILDYPNVAAFLVPGDLSRCIDYDLWKKAIAGGMPLRGPAGFGITFSQVGARPLIRLFKDLRLEYPDMELEGREALHKAVEKGSPRQIALLIWAGVDPLQPYEDPFDDASSTSAYYYAPAVVEAINCYRLDLLKLMKLHPDEDQWLGLVEAAASSEPEILRFILGLNPDAYKCITARPQVHCELLNAAVHRLWDANMFAKYLHYSKPVSSVGKCVGLLLACGAQLNAADQRRLTHIRACLYRADDIKIIEIVDELAKYEGDEHTAGLIALINKPKLRSIVQRMRPQLCRRLFGDPPEKRHKPKNLQRSKRRSDL